MHRHMRSHSDARIRAHKHDARARVVRSPDGMTTGGGPYMPSILVDSQVLPGRTVVFSNGNDAFRRYRARSAHYQRHSKYEHLAVLNKHKLTDDDYKTGVLTRFEGRQARSCYKAGVQHEVLWLASSAALIDWNFKDVRHIIHYDLPSDAVTYVLRSTIARGAQVTTFVNTDHGGGSETKSTPNGANLSTPDITGQSTKYALNRIYRLSNTI